MSNKSWMLNYDAVKGEKPFSEKPKYTCSCIYNPQIKVAKITQYKLRTDDASERSHM